METQSCFERGDARVCGTFDGSSLRIDAVGLLPESALTLSPLTGSGFLFAPESVTVSSQGTIGQQSIEIAPRPGGSIGFDFRAVASDANAFRGFVVLGE
jgi:hypothetical protein